MDLQLTGRVALVTAASRGIGRAVAEQLASEGATVAVAARDRAALAAAAAGFTGPGRLVPHPVDLADPEATAGLVGEVVSAHGGLDALVVNTPGPPLKPILETTLDDWAAAYDTLVRPAVQLALAAAPVMRAAGGGSIVFLTSTWVRQTTVAGGLSAAMRSAVSALSKQLALELAPAGVRVNQVMPGATRTGRTEAVLAAKAQANGTSVAEEAAAATAAIPLGRWGEPAEIARVVALLVSPAGGYLTGCAVPVDGGQIRSTV